MRPARLETRNGFHGAAGGRKQHHSCPFSAANSKPTNNVRVHHEPDVAASSCGADGENASHVTGDVCGSMTCAVKMSAHVLAAFCGAHTGNLNFFQYLASGVSRSSTCGKRRRRRRRNSVAAVLAVVAAEAIATGHVTHVGIRECISVHPACGSGEDAPRRRHAPAITGRGLGRWRRVGRDRQDITGLHGPERPALPAPCPKRRAAHIPSSLRGIRATVPTRLDGVYIVPRIGVFTACTRTRAKQRPTATAPHCYPSVVVHS